MSDNGNIKWEKMLVDVMKEGKSIKKRRMIIGSSLFTFIGLLFIASAFLFQVEKGELEEDLFTDTVEQSEIEVALISTDTFFDDDLELLIY